MSRMFGSRFWAARHWMARFWSNTGSAPAPISVLPPARRTFTPDAEARTWTPEAEVRTWEAA